MYIQHIFPCDQCKDTGIWGIISASDASDTMLLCQALICLEDFALKSLGPFLHLVPGAAPQFCARAAKEAVLYSKKVELSHLYGNQTFTPLPSHSGRRNTSCTWHREGRGQRSTSCLVSALSAQSSVTLTRKELKNNWRCAECKAFFLLKVSRTTLFAQMERLSVLRKILRIRGRNLIDDTWHFPSLLSQNRQSLLLLILLRPHRGDCMHFSSSTWADCQLPSKTSHCKYQGILFTY